MATSGMIEAMRGHSEAVQPFPSAGHTNISGSITALYGLPSASAVRLDELDGELAPGSRAGGRRVFPSRGTGGGGAEPPTCSCIRSPQAMHLTNTANSTEQEQRMANTAPRTGL